MNGACAQEIAQKAGPREARPAPDVARWPASAQEGRAGPHAPGALLLCLDPILPGRILCEGCPAHSACLPEPMSYRHIDRVVSEARPLGVRRFLLLSHKPAAYGGEVLDLALKHRDCLFLLLGVPAVPDEALAAELAGADNLHLVVNATDLICGGTGRGVSGASRLTEQTLQLLRAEGTRFGYSCCCTRRDLAALFVREGVEQLAALGAGFGMYFPYMPRSWNSAAPLAPSAAEWAAAGERIRTLRGGVSIPLFDWTADFRFLDGPDGRGSTGASTLLHAVDSRIQHVTLEESLELARETRAAGEAGLGRNLPAEAAEMSPQQRSLCPTLADAERLRRTVYANL